ncbi:MAG: KEOPS complex subunit Pcc1 [Candidatus Micrarchaeota archaeon]
MPDFKAVLEVPFTDTKTARKAYDSLIQETEFIKKSTTVLMVKGKTLLIKINADDFASLRATMNSYTRLISVFYGVKAAAGPI